MSELIDTPITTFGLLDYAASKYPGKTALSFQYKGNNVKYTYNNLKEKAEDCALGLLRLGLKKGDKIAIITNNCPEWYILDNASARIGVVTVSLLPAYSATDIEHILKDANVTYIFTSNKVFYNMVEPIATKIEGFRGIYSFEKLDLCPHFYTLLDKEENAAYQADYLKINAGMQPDDLYTISYTSGTGGNPKGIEVLHRGIVNACYSAGKAVGLTENDRALCFLSVAHLYERGHHFAYFFHGVEINLSLSTLSPADNLKLIKPTIFTSVPLILLTIVNGILKDSKIDEETKNAALNVAYNYEFGDEEKPEYNAVKNVLNSFYNDLGGNIRVACCGGAPMIEKIHRFFWAVGAPLYEAYGLSECFWITYARGREYTRFGTLGAVSAEAEVKIADDNEILCKIPFIMNGYHNLPEYTKKVINEEGWIHTGDTGEWVEGKFLKLTGRKKDIFKVSSGYYISPAVVEGKLAKSPYLLRSIIFEYEGGVGMIFQPEYNLFAKEMGISIDNIKQPEYEQAITNKIVDEAGKYYNNFAISSERIIKFILDPTERTVENGDLTPTMKVKREKIIKDIIR